MDKIKKLARHIENGNRVIALIKAVDNQIDKLLKRHDGLREKLKTENDIIEKLTKELEGEFPKN